MYSSIGLLFLVSFLGYEIARGTAILGLNHVVRRRKAPGPFWFIILLQAFMSLVCGAFAAYFEFVGPVP